VKRLGKFLRITEIGTGFMYAAGAIAICLLFLSMFGDVAGRFLFNAPIQGTAELSEYLLIAIAFLSLGYAQLKGMHTAVDTVVRHFPKKLRTLLNIILSLLAIGFFAIMAQEIGQRAYLDWKNNILLSRTAVKWPVWYKSFFGALGCFGLIVALVMQIAQNIVKLVTPLNDSSEDE